MNWYIAFAVLFTVSFTLTGLFLCACELGKREDKLRGYDE